MSSLPEDLRSTASMNYTSLQIFFPALSRGDELLTDEERSKFDPLLIPETVVYNYGKPTERFVSNPLRGGVVRRMGRLTTEGLWDDFSLNPCSATRRSALWIAESSEGTRAMSQMRDVRVDITCQEKGSTNLRLFLQRIKGKGLLQQIVESKRESDGSTRSVIFLCHFSQHRFSVDKLTSLFNVSGVGGAESPPPPAYVFSPHCGSYNTTLVPPSRTFNQLKKHCDRVALTLGKFYKAKVMTMTLGFRFDCDENLFLSWCDCVSLCVMTPTGPCTYNADAFGTRVVSSPPPTITAKETKFSLKDPKDTPHPCAVCSTVCPRGALCGVQLRWLLMSLSMMDGFVERWQGEVPPSVALVCPDLTAEGYRELKATIANQPLFRLICGDCFERAETAIHHMTANRMRAPDWLGVDATPRKRLEAARAAEAMAANTAAAGSSKQSGLERGRRASESASNASALPYRTFLPSREGGGEQVPPPITALPLYAHSEGRWRAARDDVLVVPLSSIGDKQMVIADESEEAFANALSSALSIAQYKWTLAAGPQQAGTSVGRGQWSARHTHTAATPDNGLVEVGSDDGAACVENRLAYMQQCQRHNPSSDACDNPPPTPT